jgi:S-adenosylmethionine hydrolase
MPIALLTDFGLRDAYVGVMKGVIAGIAGDVPVIDISHAIPPQDIRCGALMLWQACRYFPTGTVFCAVVDPGVGSERLPLAVEAGPYRFVGPDNGLLSYTLAQFPSVRAVGIQSALGDPSALSSTFHGRDLFAPVAAMLSIGTPLDELGETVRAIKALPWPLTAADDGQAMTGEIMQIDHFGNALTSIGVLSWQQADQLRLDTPLSRRTWYIPADANISVGQLSLTKVRHSYSETTIGKPLALVSSSGLLEISINQGNAAREFDLQVGMPVVVTYDSR